MGVDYDGVGGIGVEVDDSMVSLAIDKGIFTQEEWDDNQYDCVEKIGMVFCTAGNSYSGDEMRYYLMVDGNNLSEVIDNADQFVVDINDKFGVKLDLVDLKVISDMHIW